ncbi:MAG TPA: Dabb family protein [Gemmatimonadales bacterium]|nr:Dabb family protein [Gemmatimonadales bacterium]
MILHLVLFRFRADVEPERLERVGRALREMKRGIPEIRDIRFGPNLGPSAAEYPHALTVLLDDMAAVQRYLDHPVHRRTVDEHVAPIREARLAVDVEWGG